MTEQDQSSIDHIVKALDSQFQQITVIGITLGVILGELSDSAPEAARRVHKNLDLIGGQLDALITDKRAKELQALLVRSAAPKGTDET